MSGLKGVAAGAGHSLSTLIKRLEAATSRLEDIASSAAEGPSSPTSATAAPGSRSIAGVASVAPSANGELTPTQGPPPEIAVPEPAVDLPQTVQDFDTMMNEDLKPFKEISEKMGGLVAEQSAAFCVAFRAQRNVLHIAALAKEPKQSEPVYMDILGDLQHGIESVNNVRDNHRKAPEENHLAMLADGVGMLAWVTIKPNPSDYIGEIVGGAQFYGNKILKEHKEKGTIDIEWVRSFVTLSAALRTYVKENFSRGLTWNHAGISPEQALKDVKLHSPTTDSSAALREPRGGAPPPPPPPLPQFDIPPPPPPPPAGAAPSSAAPAGGLGAVFDELNKGSSVTAGLRKVDKSEMTHKNPSLRAAAPVPTNSEQSGRVSPAPGRKPDSLRSKKPARKELEGNKWSIENYDNEKSPITVDAEKHHSILISRCNASAIQIRGKANAISIDNCARLDLIIDSLVSSVSIVSSQNFRLQVMGSLPSVEMDKVDAATVYLSLESLHTEIYTSKCTGINVTLPPKEETAEDSVECPLPEQIRSWIEGGKVMSEIVKDA